MSLADSVKVVRVNIESIRFLAAAQQAKRAAKSVASGDQDESGSAEGCR
jgi:hypothetical protein